MISEAILGKVYKERKDWSFKYDFGSLLIIGGSKLYHGAPALAGLAALRSGVDLVTIAAPERAADLIAGVSPDLITYPLNGDYLSQKHIRQLIKLSEKKTAVLIGNGLGKEKETISAVIKFLRKNKLPVVIDADALTAVSKNEKVIKKNNILTPHFHEFYLLSGKEAAADLKRVVKLEAKRLHATILLKAHIDTISNGVKVEQNKTGSIFMTKGGTGDTIAGICASLLAQGNSSFTAACAAAYINGKAGELAAKEKQQGLLATDIIGKIPEVFSC